MKKLALLLIVPFALLLGVQTASAQKAKSPQTATNTVRAEWDSYKPETIEGRISMIEVNQKVMVMDVSGVPYDITITGKTKIEINGTASTFNDLVGQTEKQATVTFVARRNGDIAQSVSISD